MKKRVKYLDGLRFVAILNVILIHVLGIFRHQYFSTSTLKYTLVTFFDCFTRIGVPLFFMLTGILMLTKKEKDENYFKFFKKRVLKFLLTYLLFSIIYYIYSHFDSNMSIYEFLAIMTSDRPMYHLWFMPVIILIYIFIPFLKKLIKTLSKKELEIIILIIFLLGNTFNAISAISLTFGPQLLINFSLPNLIIYMNYLFIGYYVYKYDIKITKTKVILSIISIILMPICSFIISKDGIKDLFLGGTSPFVIMPTIVVFLFFKNNYSKVKMPNIIDNFISNNAGNIFYIYLWHVLVVEILNKILLKYRINARFLEDIIWMIIYYIITIIISFIIAIIWDKLIKTIKKLTLKYKSIKQT